MHDITITKAFPFPYTINAKNSINFNITNSIALDGYKPLGIVGYAINSQNVQVVNLRLLGNDWDVYLYNNNDSQVSTNLDVVILYAKNI